MQLRAMRKRRLAFIVGWVPVVIGTTACLATPNGLVTTPGAPTQGAASRLPSLLSQLQSASGAGLDVFSGTPQSQVLAAQDAQGKGTGIVNLGTPIVTSTASPPSVAGASNTTGAVGATPTLRPGSATTTATAGNGTTTPGASSPSPTGTAPTTATATSSATPTATPTLAGPTATPTPSGPPRESGGAAGTPPPEG